MSPTETVVVLDFGSQYAQLIARRVREQHVFARILPYSAPLADIRALNPVGIILSGGPANVYADNAPQGDAGIFALGVPILGICYGCQWLCEALGGAVQRATRREFGAATLTITAPDELLRGLATASGGGLPVWMSHGDQIVKLPAGFQTLAQTATCPHAAIAQPEKKFYGVQFHPEVAHTPCGKDLLRNFLYRICRVKGNWEMRSFVEDAVAAAREQIGGANVVLALSGGVDSTVVALLLQRAVGAQLHCIFVDNGGLRKNEFANVVENYRRDFQLNLIPISAGKTFLDRLAGVADPETKRKIIGHTFIDIFTEEARKIADCKFLAQGTLYPDVIESVSAHGGPTAVIKSHHNVGGLPEKLGFELVEPLRWLFKDEVRSLGAELGMPEPSIWRHPFPGPGLAVRIVGEVTAARVAVLQEADEIVMQEIQAAGWYRKVWQAFAVLLPVASVGVMGDERTYENTVALRVVDSLDGMTADWSRLPYDLLAKISGRIINEVRGVNRVVYDISSKPPSTIEWE
ncbi:MAG: glutamine-hydrolyzing GMP synthase [Planctomycetota bacterium]|jgi:GMP synthase (glutamine-hydrolysing)|nr:glutamine-hydrolyzing GMP synthase [Planctomycetota bacterium]